MQDYNEILENMKDKYFEIRGSDPDEECDSGILLRLMAGEVYSLEAYADWLKAAMFVSSAHGEALDHHAAQRGLERKTGSKASGTVRVSVDVPLEYDVVIPQGTVFTTSDGQLYYESVSQASILSGTGSTFVEVNARVDGFAERSSGLDHVFGGDHKLDAHSDRVDICLFEVAGHQRQMDI